ncbi:MAG: kynureninase, partial [Bdellovibrionaceae bacterium]|nr:kynureninase [Pseudobdellovibrionaceae bacterium]
YFAGHSLGLMPLKAQQYVNEELEAWARLGVEGHFHARNPWIPYHENLTSSFARLVGAKPSEVVAMNSLTVNLHLLMVSFYRPNQKRFKILIENNTFPSDRYAVSSQAKFHGFSESSAIVELEPSADGLTVSSSDVVEQIKSHGDSLALVLLGNCNYLSGQRFDFPRVVEAARSVGAMVGFNLAHGAGNLLLELHDWDVDFAVWCSYKYLNAGPGGIAGAFVHEKHHRRDLPRFAGWWGHDKQTRFLMGPRFDPIPSVESWQLSNPPILQLASLRASMEIFDSAGMITLRQKGDRLTGYLEWLLRMKCADWISIVTPLERGSMLCVRIKSDPKKMLAALKERQVIVDFREPDILRMTPVPLYNSFSDVWNLVSVLEKCR